MKRKLLWIPVFMLLGSCVAPSNAMAACEPEPITANTPTGIAGCEVWGEGVGSHYGPGNGVAMNFCTWEKRHGQGCGFVTITSGSTGLSGTFPVVDFCDCYTGTDDQRVVDMQYGVLAALGLDRSQGLYPVIVQPAGSTGASDIAPAPVAPQTTPAPIVLPDTAVENCGALNGLIVLGFVAIGAALVGAFMVLYKLGRMNLGG